MIEHISTEKIHDLLDGLLSAAEEDEVGSHVDACAVCRSEVARMGDVVQAVRGLPRSGHTPDGTWEGIQGRIGGTEPGEARDASVVEFPGARARRRRFHFSAPQLAAAAIVVSLMSAGTVWMAVGGLASSVTPAVATAEPQGSVVRAALVDAGYTETVQELEDILLQGRDLLAPETVATIDRSLRTIDEALNEVQAAIEADPSSEVLGRMLVNYQRSRLRLLRQAAEAVWARS